MQFKVTQKNTRQSPRKVRLIANTIKDLPLEQAIKQLAVIERRATLVVLKTIKQAIANAKNNHGVDASNLKIKEITVNEGPRYRRFQAVSRGRAHGIIKRTSHVSVTLEEVKAGTGVASKAVATKAVETKAEESKQVSKQALADRKAQLALKADTKAGRKAANTGTRLTKSLTPQAAVKKSTSK